MRTILLLTLMLASVGAKRFSVTFTVDEGNLRGKPRTEVVVADSCPEANATIRQNNPGARIITCSEVPGK